MKNKKVIIVLISISVLLLLSASIFFLLYVPDIKLNGSKKITISYKDKYEEKGFTAKFANFDFSKNIHISNNIQNGKIGTYTINYEIKNLLKNFSKSKKRIINIVDNDLPKIELVGDVIYLDINQEYNEPGYKAIDDYDGDITKNVLVKNNINIKTAGEYEVTYEAMDSSKNKASVKRKVIVHDTNAKSIPILTYHHFMTQNEKNSYASDDKYTVSTNQFEEHLKYLKDNGYNTISLDELYSWYTSSSKLTSKDVVLVIDDGNISSYRYAIPLIEKYGFKATIFVITGRISNQKQDWDPTVLKFFNEEIIDDIRKNHKNIFLASHTHYLHAQVNGACAVASASEQEIYDDVLESKKVIKSDYLAYPFGCHKSESTSALKKAGYKMAFEFGDNKRATKNDDIYAMKRININAYTSMNDFIKWLEE